MSQLPGRLFYKMTGSGNDFVFFDTRNEEIRGLESPNIIQRLCTRGIGIGADGVVFLAKDPRADIGIRYYNADGSIAALCGNATLCVTRLAVTLGGVDPAGFTIATGSGVLRARVQGGIPEFDFPAIADAQSDYAAIGKVPGELHLGYVIAGVPHVVIQVPDVTTVDVVGRGRPVRYHTSLSAGANVNFVSRLANGRWAIRTYERGVEDETLACGTGNVASAIMLNLWSEAGDNVELVTRSGQPLGVRLTRGPSGEWITALRGEGRLVFQGEIKEL